MITYKVIAEHLSNDILGKYTAFGIAALNLADNNSIVEYISDVFTDRSSAEALVSLCNKFMLAPEHLRDVIEDMI